MNLVVLLNFTNKNDQNDKRYENVWENMTLWTKIWDSVQTFEKVCKHLRKCAKLWEYVQKTWECEKSWVRIQKVSTFKCDSFDCVKFLRREQVEFAVCEFIDYNTCTKGDNPIK